MRHKIKPITEYSDAIPLVNILPLHVTQYPLVRRQLQKHDFVIDITDYQNTPFAFTVYLKRERDAEPVLLNRFRKYDLYKHYEFDIKPGWKICAVAYSNPLTFMNWQDMEYEVTSRSNEKGGETVWVLFRDS